MKLEQAKKLIASWEYRSGGKLRNYDKQLASAKKLLNKYPFDEIVDVIGWCITNKRQKWIGVSAYAPRVRNLIDLARPAGRKPPVYIRMVSWIGNNVSDFVDIDDIRSKNA